MDRNDKKKLFNLLCEPFDKMMLENSRLPEKDRQGLAATFASELWIMSEEIRRNKEQADIAVKAVTKLMEKINKIESEPIMSIILRRASMFFQKLMNKA